MLPVCRARIGDCIPSFRRLRVPHFISANSVITVCRRRTLCKNTNSWEHTCLPEPPHDFHGDPRTTFNAVTLAFLGDGVWEALVRQHVWKSSSNSTSAASVKRLHEYAADHANASRQAEYHDMLLLSSCPEEDLMKEVGVDLSTDSIQTSDSQDIESAEGTLSSTEPHAESLKSNDESKATKTSLNSEVGESIDLQLNEAEIDLMRWARNSGGLTVPKGQDNLVYKKATALEALVAHLYLTDPNRCVQIVDALLSSKAATKSRTS